MVIRLVDKRRKSLELVTVETVRFESRLGCSSRCFVSAV